MTHRVLPVDEWPRLGHTYLAPLVPHLPVDAQVVVVENDLGAIVGCWALFRMPHLEGCWIDPQDRRHGSVARQLLAGVGEAAAAWGATRAVTASLDREVTELLERLGAEALPGDHFVLPLGRT